MTIVYFRGRNVCFLFFFIAPLPIRFTIYHPTTDYLIPGTRYRAHHHVHNERHPEATALVPPRSCPAPPPSLAATEPSLSLPPFLSLSLSLPLDFSGRAPDRDTSRSRTHALGGSFSRSRRRPSSSCSSEWRVGRYRRPRYVNPPL